VWWRQGEVVVQRKPNAGTDVATFYGVCAGEIEIGIGQDLHAPLDAHTLDMPINGSLELKLDANHQKSCCVHFEAATKELAVGKFGFDWMRDHYSKDSANFSKLKAEYTPITINGIEYFAPWLNIRKGETVKLRLRKSNCDKIKSLTIEPASDDFTFEPTELKGTKFLHITCNTTLERDTQFRVMADDKVVGALNVWQNTVGTVRLRWAFVEVRGKGADNKALAGKVSLEKLRNGLRRAFHPTSIDVEVLNTDPVPIDASAELSNYLVEKNGDLYVEEADQLKFGEVAAKNDHSRKNGVVNLYFFNARISKSKVADIPDEGEFELIAGYSPELDSGQANVFLDGNNEMPGDIIAHEIMHALGLPHSFPEKDNASKKHMFKRGTTDNYMDYDNKRKHTWKWQWKLLMSSRFTRRG
jgi:hypothetical protein